MRRIHREAPSDFFLDSGIFRWIENLQLPQESLQKLEGANQLLRQTFLDAGMPIEDILWRLFQKQKKEGKLADLSEKYLALLCFITFLGTRKSTESVSLNTNPNETQDIIREKFFGIFNIRTNKNALGQDFQRKKDIMYLSNRVENLTWFFLSLKTNPNLIQLLPARVQIERAKGKHDDELYALMNEKERDQLEDHFFRLLMSSKQAIITIPATINECHRLQHQFYKLTPEIPIEYYDFSLGSFSPYYNKVVLYTDSSPGTRAHELQHQNNTGVRLQRSLGTGLDEAITEYLAHRNIESFRRLYTLWHAYSEEAIRITRWENPEYLSRIFVTTLPLVLAILPPLLLKTIGSTIRNDREVFSIHDDLIALLKTIFHKHPDIQSAMIHRYQKQNSSTIRVFWNTLITHLGVETTGAIMGWQYGNNDQFGAVTNLMLEKQLEEPAIVIPAIKKTLSSLLGRNGAPQNN